MKIPKWKFECERRWETKHSYGVMMCLSENHNQFKRRWWVHFKNAWNYAACHMGTQTTIITMWQAQHCLSKFIEFFDNDQIQFNNGLLVLSSWQCTNSPCKTLYRLYRTLLIIYYVSWFILSFWLDFEPDDALNGKIDMFEWQRKLNSNWYFIFIIRNL